MKDADSESGMHVSLSLPARQFDSGPASPHRRSQLMPITANNAGSRRPTLAGTYPHNGERMMSTPPQDTSRGGQGPASPGGPRRTDSEEFKKTARHLAEEAKIESQARVEGMRDTAAGKAETLADSAQAAASTLREDDIGHLSEYVSDFADRISTLSTSLRDKSGDEILRDVGRMARENPALFVTGSILIGFGIARFARASQEKSQENPTSSRSTDTGDSTYSPYATASGADTSGAYAGAGGATAGTGAGSSFGGTTAGSNVGSSQSPDASNPGAANPIRPGTDQSGTSGTQGGIH